MGKSVPLNGRLSPLLRESDMSVSSDQPPTFLDTLGSAARGTAKAERDVSFSRLAAQNIELAKMNPASSLPPATDRGVVSPVWYSFDLAHRRVQEGGWTHQVTRRELPSSEDIAGVTMRLTPGSFRLCCINFVGRS